MRCHHLPCAFKPIDAEEVDAELDGALCVSDGGCVCEVSPRKLLSYNHLERDREKGREKDRGRLTALVQYDTPSLLQLPDDWPGAVASCLDDLDALVDDGLGVSAIVRRVEGRQQGDVDAERVLGHRPALLDLLAQVCWGWEDEARDDAKTAGVGDCAGQLGVSDVLEQGARSQYFIVCSSR